MASWLLLMLMFRLHRMQIKQLIGTFSLDPNRVADLCYEAFECHLDQHGFVQLLPMFGPAAMLHMLGLKFQMEQASVHALPLATYACLLLY